jgi:hypothetical protein
MRPRQDVTATGLRRLQKLHSRSMLFQRDQAT